VSNIVPLAPLAAALAETGDSMTNAVGKICRPYG
jgi:hypothetical protein